MLKRGAPGVEKWIGFGFARVASLSGGSRGGRIEQRRDLGVWPFSSLLGCINCPGGNHSRSLQSG